MLVERERDRADRADVVRDVVAALAVAAGGSQDELAAFVAEVDGDAVDFGIGDVAAGDGEAGAVGLGEGGVVFFAELAALLLGALLPPLRAASSSSVMASSFGSVASYARAAHLRRSAASYVLSIENIGRAWATVRKPSIGSPPTRCVGLSGVMRSGWAASRSRSSARSLSYSRSEIDGRGVDVVAAVVLADLLAKVGDALFESHVGR